MSKRTFWLMRGLIAGGLAWSAWYIAAYFLVPSFHAQLWAVILNCFAAGADSINWLWLSSLRSHARHSDRMHALIEEYSAMNQRQADQIMRLLNS